MDDLRALVEGLRKRILVAHGGTGSPMLDHWNLTERDSLLHKAAADALDRLAAVERDAEKARELLTHARCPQKCTNGTTPYGEQCQWCDERAQLFAAIAARKGEG